MQCTDFHELIDIEKDEIDFKNDIQDLDSQQDELLRIIFNVKEENGNENISSQLNQEKEKLKTLIDNQIKQRSTYKSIRNPTASLTIDHNDLKFLSVIGKGGFGVVWKGEYQGVIVTLFYLGCHQENISR